MLFVSCILGFERGGLLTQARGGLCQAYRRPRPLDLPPPDRDVLLPLDLDIDLPPDRDTLPPRKLDVLLPPDLGCELSLDLGCELPPDLN